MFQPDWKTRLPALKSRIHYRASTLKEKISDATYRHLAAAPGKELPYAELMMRLKQEFQRPTATLYTYVAGLDFVERLDVPGTRNKVCRLRVALVDELALGVRDIHDEDLRKSLERAVRFLTEADVDVGLFLLGKEFESMLKKYLGAAAANGVISAGRDPAKMKLVDLVTCAKQNRIIVDEGTLQYLRQQRNDRAHDPTPTLAERRIMLQNAPHFASLYIDYIKLLNNLLKALG